MVQEWDCDTPLEVAAWSVCWHVLAVLLVATSAWYGLDTASRFADFLSCSEPFLVIRVHIVPHVFQHFKDRVHLL